MFDNPITIESAYRLICLHNADLGGRNAVSARGWLRHSSWISSMTLTDGSRIYRDPVSGELYHANVTVTDTLSMFGLNLEMLKGKSASYAAFCERHCIPYIVIKSRKDRAYAEFVRRAIPFKPSK